MNFIFLTITPEHLTPDYIADGTIPSSIAHFGSLEPGVYTVFSYHHRGDSDDYQADLYYDTVFSSENGGSFEILQIGLDKNWDWNRAWADYTNTPVQMRYIIEYLTAHVEREQHIATG